MRIILISISLVFLLNVGFRIPVFVSEYRDINVDFVQAGYSATDTPFGTIFTVTKRLRSMEESQRSACPDIYEVAVFRTNTWMMIPGPDVVICYMEIIGGNPLIRSAGRL